MARGGAGQRLALAAACGAAIVCAGCGGTSASSSPTTVQVGAVHTPAAVHAPAPITPREYSARVNAICRDFHARLPHVAGGTPTALALEASEDLPLLRESEKQEAAVPVPPSEESTVHALRKALEAKYQQTAAIPGIIAREGITGEIRIEGAFAEVGGEVVALDHQLGLGDCAKA